MSEASERTRPVTRGRIVFVCLEREALPVPAIVVDVGADQSVTCVAFSDQWPLTCTRLMRGVKSELRSLGVPFWFWPPTVQP